MPNSDLGDSLFSSFHLCGFVSLARISVTYPYLTDRPFWEAYISFGELIAFVLLVGNQEWARCPSTAFTTACDCSAVMGKFGNKGLEVSAPHRFLVSLLDGQRMQRETFCLFRGTKSLSVLTIVRWKMNNRIFLSTLWTGKYLD